MGRKFETNKWENVLKKSQDIDPNYIGQGIT